MLYSKPALSIDQQIQRLKDRGLEIPNESEARHYLQNIGYYRLAGYWWPLQSDKENHIFKPEASFSRVIELYNFDRELRIILFKVIEKIEISFRTKLIYHVSHEFDPWWFQDTRNFSDAQALVKTLGAIQEEVERSKDTFIKEHKKKYKSDGRFPPAWKALELTSFGNLSKLYGNLASHVKSKDTIAKEYNAVNHTYLKSWLQTIVQIRNICAHHGRLWNKNLPGAPKLLPKPPTFWIAEVPKQHEFQKLYIHLCLMKYLLLAIHPNNKFTKELVLLLNDHPNVDPNALGFKTDWEQEQLWKH